MEISTIRSMISFGVLRLYNELAGVHSEFGDDIFQLLDRQSSKACPTHSHLIALPRRDREPAADACFFGR
jgi:hypothetical protein